jgi:uncharacterized membrane protein YhaH (DUF805 family)
MGFYIDFWKNFVNFSGKTGLKDYWLTFLINIVISAILLKINANIASIFGLAVFIPFLAISARRLRDAGLHVLLVLTFLIPIVLLILCVFPSKR